MVIAFSKIDLGAIDEMPGFFKKLKEFLGGFRIEAQDLNDVISNRMVISFLTDKIEFKEGESRQVCLTAENLPDGGWKFTGIDK